MWLNLQALRRDAITTASVVVGCDGTVMITSPLHVKWQESLCDPEQAMMDEFNDCESE